MSSEVVSLLNINQERLDRNKNSEEFVSNRDDVDGCDSKIKALCEKSNLNMTESVAATLNLEGKKISRFRVVIESDESDDNDSSDDIDETLVNNSELVTNQLPHTGGFQFDSSVCNAVSHENSLPHCSDNSVSTDVSSTTVKQKSSYNLLNLDSFNVIDIKEEKLDDSIRDIIKIEELNCFEINDSKENFNESISNRLSNGISPITNGICDSTSLESSVLFNDEYTVNNKTDEKENNTFSSSIPAELKTSLQELKNNGCTDNNDSVQLLKHTNKTEINESGNKKKQKEILYSGEVKNKYTCVFSTIEEEVEYLTKQALAKKQISLYSDSDDEDDLYYYNLIKSRFRKRILLRKNIEIQKLESKKKKIRRLNRKARKNHSHDEGLNGKDNNVIGNLSTSVENVSINDKSSTFRKTDSSLNDCSEENGKNQIDDSNVEKIAGNFGRIAINLNIENNKTKPDEESLIKSIKMEEDENEIISDTVVKIETDLMDTNILSEEHTNRETDRMKIHENKTIENTVDGFLINPNEIKTEIDSSDEIDIIHENQELIKKDMLKDVSDKINEEIRLDKNSLNESREQLKRQMTEFVNEEGLNIISNQNNIDGEKIYNPDSSTNSLVIDTSSEHNSSSDRDSEILKDPDQMTDSKNFTNFTENSGTSVCEELNDGSDRIITSKGIPHYIIHKDVEDIVNHPQDLPEEDIMEELNLETLNAVQSILDLDKAPDEKECAAEPSYFVNPPVEVEPEEQEQLEEQDNGKKRKQRNKKKSSAKVKEKKEKVINVKLKCPNCIRWKFSCFDELWKHFKDDHLTEDYEVSSSKFIIKKEHKCHLCDVELTYGLLERHELLDHTDSPHSCPHCFCTFVNCLILERHVKQQHLLQIIRRKRLLQVLSCIESRDLKIIKTTNSYLNVPFERIMFNSPFPFCSNCDCKFDLDTVILNLPELTKPICVNEIASDGLLHLGDLLANFNFPFNLYDDIGRVKYFMVITTFRSYQKVKVLEGSKLKEKQLKEPSQCNYCDKIMRKSALRYHISVYHPESIGIVPGLRNRTKIKNFSNEFTLTQPVSMKPSSEPFIKPYKPRTKRKRPKIKAQPINLKLIKTDCTDNIIKDGSSIKLDVSEGLTSYSDYHETDENSFVIETNHKMKNDLPLNKVLVFQVNKDGTLRKRLISKLSTSSETNSSRNMEENYADFKYECDLCHERFRWISMLKLHRTLSHQSCSHCNELFDNVTGLREHIISVHPKERSWNITHSEENAESNGIVEENNLEEAAIRKNPNKVIQEINSYLDSNENSEGINLNVSRVLPLCNTEVSSQDQCEPLNISRQQFRNGITIRQMESVDTVDGISVLQIKKRRSLKINNPKGKQNCITSRAEDRKFKYVNLDYNEQFLIDKCLKSQPVVLLERCTESTARNYDSKSKPKVYSDKLNKLQIFSRRKRQIKGKHSSFNLIDNFVYDDDEDNISDDLNKTIDDYLGTYSNKNLSETIASTHKNNDDSDFDWNPSFHYNNKKRVYKQRKFSKRVQKYSEEFSDKSNLQSQACRRTTGKVGRRRKIENV